MQTKNATADPQTHENSGLRHLHGQETNREQREKTAESAPGTATSQGARSRGRCPKPRQHRGNGQKKSQPDKGWDFTLWWWRGTLRQTYVTQRPRTAANSCGKVRNPALHACNPTSSALSRSSVQGITEGASSIPICGIEPASANQSVASLNKAQVAARPTMTSSDFARLMPT